MEKDKLTNIQKELRDQIVSQAEYDVQHSEGLNNEFHIVVDERITETGHLSIILTRERKDARPTMLRKSYLIYIGRRGGVQSMNPSIDKHLKPNKHHTFIF
jgi:hypothetical protein